MQFTHTNDLTGKPCRIVKEDISRQDLIDMGVTPSSTMTLIRNEDGTLEHIFPWELTEITP